MKKLILAGAMASLVGCSSLPVDNMTACVADLSKVPSANVTVLLAAAFASPACQMLTFDIIQKLIGQVSAEHMAQGMHR